VSGFLNMFLTLAGGPGAHYRVISGRGGTFLDLIRRGTLQDDILGGAHTVRSYPAGRHSILNHIRYKGYIMESDQ
jgi:hypothetical protein